MWQWLHSRVFVCLCAFMYSFDRSALFLLVLCVSFIFFQNKDSLNRLKERSRKKTQDKTEQNKTTEEWPYALTLERVCIRLHTHRYILNITCAYAMDTAFNTSVQPNFSSATQFHLLLSLNISQFICPFLFCWASSFFFSIRFVWMCCIRVGNR